MGNPAMKLLITGGNGLLGSNLIWYFSSMPGWDVVATSLNESACVPSCEFISGDLADPVFARRLLDETAPDVVINTVALVDIEKCENEPELAARVNITTAKNLAEALNGKGCRLIHVSTDHFFNGAKSFYTEDDSTGPVNNYGRSKLEAEGACLENHANTAVIRTNFYGWCRGAHRQTFGEWMYRSLRDRVPIKLFTDFYFTPIEVDHLAQAIETVSKSDFTGVINIAGSERVSKYDFGLAMAAVFGFSLENVVPMRLNAGAFSVQRPADLSLSTDKFVKIFGRELPDLKAGLKLFKETMSTGSIISAKKPG